jgi:hypothetical protein
LHSLGWFVSLLSATPNHRLIVVRRAFATTQVGKGY